MDGENEGEIGYVPVAQEVKITKNHGQYIIRIPQKIVDAIDLTENDTIMLTTTTDVNVLLAKVIKNDATPNPHT
jgi:hypothetical protein